MNLNFKNQMISEKSIISFLKKQINERGGFSLEILEEIDNNIYFRIIFNPQGRRNIIIKASIRNIFKKDLLEIEEIIYQYYSLINDRYNKNNYYKEGKYELYYTNYPLDSWEDLIDSPLGVELKDFLISNNIWDIINFISLNCPWTEKGNEYSKLFCELLCSLCTLDKTEYKNLINFFLEKLEEEKIIYPLKWIK